MAQTVVTRNAQITLTREVRERLGIREGDIVIINVVGEQAMLTKRDPGFWRSHEPCLPEDFGEVLRKMRGDSRERLRRLGLTP